MRIIRFIIVGTMAAGIHLSVLVICVEKFFINPVIANMFAFLVAFLGSFLGQYFWTFKPTHKQYIKSFFRYLVVQIAGCFLVSQTLFFIFYQYILLNYLYAMIFSVLFTSALTYLLSYLWALKPNDNTAQKNHHVCR